MQANEPVHLFCKGAADTRWNFWYERVWSGVRQTRHTHPTRSPDLSISHVFTQPEKKQKKNCPNQHGSRGTLAAKSPQGRGDEAECLLVAVKS